MDQSYLRMIIEGIGVLTFALYLFRSIKFIHLHTRRSSIGRYLHNDQPTWALVTGASDGIGLQIVRCLAARGFNVVLHGRNSSKLEKVKSGLKQSFPDRDFQIFIAEATEMDAIPQVVPMVESLPGQLKVLINNCGGLSILPRIYSRFADETTAQQVDDALNMNARFTLQMTLAILPLLMRDSPGLVLNITSAAGVIGPPYVATYSGAKACVDCWSAALQRELKIQGKDVEITSVISGLVTSVSWLKDAASLFIPDSETFARAALDKVGCGRSVVWGFWSHSVQQSAMHWIPWPLNEWLLAFVSTKYRNEELKSK